MIYKIKVQEFEDFTEKSLFEKFKNLENNQKKINIALAGGKTPLPILKKLSKRTLNWSKYNFFIVDERNVPINNPESNYGNINKFFFSKINSKKFSIVKENLNIDQSIEKYIKELYENIPKRNNNIPVLDLIILGMGEDGHIASLFPDTDAIKETKKLVVKNYVPKLKSFRFTMTFPLLLNAKEIVIIIKGEEKEKIINDLANNNNLNYPIKKIINSNVKYSFIIGA